MKQWTTGGGLAVTRLASGRSNAYLISSGEGTARRALMVDTSWRFDWPGLRADLDRLGEGRLVGLIITHTHFDHAENAARVKERYAPAVFVHQAEADFLARGENLFPAGTIPLTRAPMALLGPRLNRRFSYPPVQADVCVGETFDLRPFGFAASILHTPGHTAGSISVIVDGEIAVVGDALFGVFPGEVFPPFGNDVPEMLRSWKKLLDTGCRVFLPAHGGARSWEELVRGFEKKSLRHPGTQSTRD